MEKNLKAREAGARVSTFAEREAVEERPFRAAFPLIYNLWALAPARSYATIVSLEKAMQYIKGGFSFRAKDELVYPGSVWQPGFENHRIRGAID